MKAKAAAKRLRKNFPVRKGHGKKHAKAKVLSIQYPDGVRPASVERWLDLVAKPIAEDWAKKAKP